MPRKKEWLHLLFYLWLFNISQGQEIAPEITSEITSFYRPAIDSYLEVETKSFIYLSISASNALRFIWTFNDTVVKNTSESVYQLTAAVENTGVYRCIAENNFAAVRSRPFTLVVKELVTFPLTSDQTFNLEEGKFVVFTPPNVTHLNTANYSWLLGGDKIQLRDSVYISLNNQLVLLNVNRNMNGNQYKVKMSHVLPTGILETTSSNFILSIAASTVTATPEFVIEPPVSTVGVEGPNVVKIECVINGQSVSLKWYQGTGSSRKEITSGTAKYTFTDSNRVLTISSVTSSDAGVYECEGSVSGQTKTLTKSTRLEILVPPKMTTSPDQKKIVKDFQEVFLISCNSTGQPTPKISWYFNGIKISDTNSTRYQLFSNGTLYIASVDLEDSGVYQCFGSNSVGEAQTYTQLVVNSAPPTITEGPTSKVVIELENTGFICRVKGGPQPDVYWTKNGVNISNGDRFWINSDQLLISRVVKSDSGLYTCTAVNIKGRVSASANLTVIIKTQITKPPQNMSKILATDATLDCGVLIDPSITPTWSWYFYKSPDFIKQNITSDSRYSILSNGSLVIVNLKGSDTGRYECAVKSQGGSDSRIATLTVIDIPGAPSITKVSLYSQIPNSVMINWTQSYDGDTPIIKFIIQNRQESFAGIDINRPWVTINSNVAPELRYAVVSGLLPSQYYRFQMKAVNQVGESEPSPAAPADEAIKMPAQPPSEAPKNLFCMPGQGQEIVVQWEPPPEASWNGILLGYYIFYKIEAFGDDTERLQNVSGKDIRQTTIINLAYNKRYRVRIAAYNEKGPGVNSSDFFVVTAQGKPSAAPINVTLASPNSTTIRAEWNPPPPGQLNGVNQGYEIEVRQNGILKKFEVVRFDEQNPIGRQSYNIVGLSKYTVYDVQIACRTAVGAGPQSPSQSIRTLEDIPGPVADLKIVNVIDQTLKIVWQPPLETNGVLTGYTITYQVKDSTASPVSVDRSNETLSHTLSNLLYETTYIISVQAKTKVGLGPAKSTEIKSGVPPELPEPPTQLAVTNIEARTVMLQFRPGDDGKTSITLWIVEAQEENNATWFRIFTVSDPSADQILVQNLRPYTRYQLRITAQNVVGNSQPSQPCNQFQTKQAAPGVPPEDVTPRAISSKAIRVRWRQIPRTEWNGDFLGYKIRYRRWSKDVDVNTTSAADLDLVRQPDWTTVELSNGSSIQEWVLSNLEEWMDYQILMISYNAVGSSNPSPTLSERTEEDVPSTFPGNIFATATSSTSITVTWLPVSILQQNGNIMGYKVIYKPRLPGAESSTYVVNGATKLTATLTGLRKYIDYDIQVLAFSRIGDGTISNFVTVKTAADVPGPPVIIYFPQVTETTATVVWQTPNEPNGIIQGYKVSYKQRDQPDSVLDINYTEKPETVFQHTVTNLTRETYYIFAVTARTENGWGEAAKVDVYTIANRGRPDPPTLRIDKDEIKARSVTIIWTAGNDNFGPVRNFTAHYKKRDDSWRVVDQAIKPQSTSYVVQGLQPNSLYMFRMVATNDVGTSDFSNESPELQTAPDKPDGAPQNVKIVALTQTSIKITWEPPPKPTWNGSPLNDVVQYREEGAGAFREDVVPFGASTTTLQALTIGIKYEIQILTTNSAGRGPPSILQVFRVGDVAPFKAPENVQMFNRSSTQIEITWQPPPAGSTNGQLIGYKVLFWQSPSNVCADGSPMQLSVTELTAVVNRLSPFTYYCCTVQAINIAGESPKSTPVSRMTSEDLPGPPENVRFQNITLNELIILWNPPRVLNGVITHYTLQYFTSVDDQQTDISNLRIPGTETRQYIDNLKENLNYTFSLSANTRIGKGASRDLSVTIGPQKGSPEAPKKPEITTQDKGKTLLLSWANQGQGATPVLAYKIYYKAEDDQTFSFVLDVNHPDPTAQISITSLRPSIGYYFQVRAINSNGISLPSAPSDLYTTPSTAVPVKQSSSPFHTQWWFLVIVALAGVIIILLIITVLCYVERRRRKGKELKRSTTSTTVMTTTPEPEEGGFPSMELRRSTRSVQRNGRTSSIYARSPPRPSPASVTYSEGNLHLVGATGGAIRPVQPDDSSSVLSEKPSNLGDSSDEMSDSDASSMDSIAKGPVPASPPPPAFSNHNNHYNRSFSNNTSSGAGASTSKPPSRHHNPPPRFQSPHNAYTYTDSEAESSHYAFSLTNGNLVVNNVAGARTPLSGFSSFV
ncbi:protein sidekick-2-like [Physella acuta]|uniref:protein sidekick-2-like n=1 Tax=Physella acuta TaxID=109671 RepID=UPI0027DBCEBD|nr:protein sidekick-2-like [Physella acuta]